MGRSRKKRMHVVVQPSTEPHSVDLEKMRTLRSALDKARPHLTLDAYNFKEVPIHHGQAWKVGGSIETLGWEPYKLLVNTASRPETFPCEPVLEAWHGTKLQNLEGIAQYSLRGGRRRCMFGRGIYTTRSLSKALSYGSQKGGGLLVILRCLVAVGKSLVPTSTGQYDKTLVGLDKQYQSVHANAGTLIGAWGGSIVNEEIVVYDPSQVFVQAVYVWKKRLGDLVEEAKPKQRVGAKALAAQRRLQKRNDVSEPVRRKTAFPTHPCHRLITLGTLSMVQRIRSRMHKKEWLLCKYAAQNRKGLHRCILNLDIDQAETCRRFLPR